MNANVGSGDRGMTSLLSGERVSKASPHVDACGEIDELCSVLGAFAASLADTSAVEGELRREIEAIQGVLLRSGALVATSSGSTTLAMLRRVGGGEIAVLEKAVERMEAELPTLQSFIIPGGHPSAAWAHVARTVCRRAERRVAELARDVGGTEDREALGGVLAHLNRLSTYLFVLARSCNKRNGVPEVTWRE